MTTEFIAFDVCSRDTALRERTISLASILATTCLPLRRLLDGFLHLELLLLDLCARGTDTHTDGADDASEYSRGARAWSTKRRRALLICLSIFRSSPRISCRHFLTCSFGSGFFSLRAIEEGG